MDLHGIETGWVQVPQSDVMIDAYLATPSAPGTFPAVVVIQEIFGVNAHIRSVVERLAKLGYVTIAPAIFQRTAPGFEVGYSLEETILARTYKDMTTATELLGDMQATIDYVRSLPQVIGDRIGSIGFCFGGHVVYLAATLPDILATASFYGGGIATMTPGGGEPTITRTPDIQGTLYAFLGTEDPLIPLDQMEEIAGVLHDQSDLHRVFCYPAGHGFFCEQRGDYNAAAAADAWEQVQRLFQHTLKAQS